MSPTAVLALRGVRRRYSDAFVLDVPSLDVRAGEVLGVIGPNGAGKSTLLRILGLLERPDEGRVLFDGRTVDARDSLLARRRMATVFQEPLLVDASVADNAALGLRFRGVAAREQAERVRPWLERLGVATLASRAARTLSGGEARRVAMARALVLEPQVLLLDEPFAGLDAPTRATLLADFGEIIRDDRITTVLVTHERSEARALADRVGVLMAGRLRQLDETAHVFHAPVAEDVARFVGVETLVAGRVLRRAAGVTAVEVGGRVIEVTTDVASGARVCVAIRPEDVTLAALDGAPRAIAARNALDGSVMRVSASTDATHVTVDVGFPLVAAVVTRSIGDMGLRPGMRVRATFDARAVHLIPG